MTNDITYKDHELSIDFTPKGDEQALAHNIGFHNGMLSALMTLEDTPKSSWGEVLEQGFDALEHGKNKLEMARASGKFANPEGLNVLIKEALKNISKEELIQILKDEGDI